MSGEIAQRVDEKRSMSSILTRVDFDILKCVGDEEEEGL
jgi:hypothetical protein